jgi:hypothetical protein
MRKPPSLWCDRYVGDSIFTNQPRAVLDGWAARLSHKGYGYEMRKHAGGHVVTCVQSPLKTLQDGVDRMMQS